MPCSDTVAVLVTVRCSDQRNASRSAAGVGSGGGPAASHRCQRRLPGLGVHPAVVDGLDPGGEQRVQLGQVGDRAAGAVAGVGDLDQELLADGAEEPFDLPAALRAGPGVEWMSLIPSMAQARSSHESTNAEPLST